MEKERINYIKEDGYFIGYPVNIKGVTIQAESLEELAIKGKVICNIAISYMTDILNQENPFEFQEVADPDIWLHGEKEASIRKELAKYKAIYGDLK